MLRVFLERVVARVLGKASPSQTNLSPQHHSLALGSGKVIVKISLPSGKLKKCRLSIVFYVPILSFNVLSVPISGKIGNVTSFCGNK